MNWTRPMRRSPPTPARRCGQKTLLGETYVELSPGSEESEPLPEGGAIPVAQVAESVQLDEIFRAFDPATRAAFKTWMQSQALRIQGARGRLLCRRSPVSSRSPRRPTPRSACLDSQRLATERLIRDGGEVFQALSERQGQLRGLIENSDAVFETTAAARNAELQEIFEILPTFLRESRTTLARLETFARDTDPVVQQLRPAARELSPTVIALGELAPDLEVVPARLRTRDGEGRHGIRRVARPPGRPASAAPRRPRALHGPGQLHPRGSEPLPA